MPVPVKPCDKCADHLREHSSAVNVIDYMTYPGQAIPQITTAHDHENHNHGQKACEFCTTHFTAAHPSFSDPHPDAPRSVLTGPGHHALVHNRCYERFMARQS